MYSISRIDLSNWQRVKIIKIKKNGEKSEEFTLVNNRLALLTNFTYYSHKFEMKKKKKIVLSDVKEINLD